MLILTHLLIRGSFRLCLIPIRICFAIAANDISFQVLLTRCRSCLLQVQHQSSECALRLVTCRFCGDMVQAGSLAADTRDRLRGLSEHESLCGSRTAPCDSCGRSVMLKEMDIHQVAVHQKS